MKDVLEKIKTRLKDNLGNQIKLYFYNHPLLVDMSSTPCICITPVSTTVNVADTGRDVLFHTIDIYLIINALTHLNRENNELVGTTYLINTMEEIDISDNTMKDNTILEAIRSDLTLDTDDNLAISNIGAIEYSPRIRSEQEVTLEARMRITVSRILVR